jgi:hypothetical protein
LVILKDDQVNKTLAKILQKDLKNRFLDDKAEALAMRIAYEKWKSHGGPSNLKDA